MAPISPSMRVAVADAELNFDLPSHRSAEQRYQAATALSLVAIAQLLEVMNRHLEHLVMGTPDPQVWERIATILSDIEIGARTR